MVPDRNPIGAPVGAHKPALDAPRRLIVDYRKAKAQGRLLDIPVLVRQFFDGLELDRSVVGEAFGQALTAGEPELALRLAEAQLIHNPNDAQWHNATGLAYAAAGRPDKAVSGFESAVDIDPEMAVAHGNLATALRATGENDKAIAHLKIAMRLCPTCEDYPFDMGNALRDNGKWDAARDAYDACLHLVPAHSGARLNLAKGLADHGQLLLAMREYRLLLQHHPDMPEALNNLGVLLINTSHVQEAVDYLKRAVSTCPDRALYAFNLGRSHQATANALEAADAYRNALVLDPTMAMAHANLGALLKSEGRYRDALDHLEKARELEPANIEMLINLGNLYERLDRFEEAADAYKEALAVEPNNTKILISYGVLLNAVGETERAASCFGQALSDDPESADAAFNLAITDLLLGRYADGWKRYGSRFRKTGWQDIYPRPCQDFGGRIEPGMHVWIHDEQGLGDTIHFARYLPMVKALGVTVTFETRPSLVPLFKGFPGIDHLVARSVVDDPPPDADAVVSLLSLPGLFLDTAGPHPAPVVFPIEDDADRWGRRIHGDQPRIGMVWAGNPGHAQDHRRSVDVTQMMMTIGNVPATWVSLQKGQAAAADLADTHPPMLALGPELQDFAQTAMAIARMDLVITVDTAVAHLAGSMGVPVWILLPFAPDWRWERHRSDSPWYPSARLFRQPAPGQWQPVFNSVAKALKQRYPTESSVDGDAVDTWFYHAAKAASENRTADAESAIAHCLNISADHPDALNLAAVMAYRNDQLESARQWIRKAAHVAPDHPDIAVNQGRIAMALGDPFEAETAFDRALEFAADHMDARIQHAELYRVTGRARAALDTIRSMVEQAPGHLPLILLLSRLYRAAGNLEEAIRWANSAKALAPGDAGVWNQLGVVMADAGQAAAADTALSHSLGLNSHQVEARVNLSALRLAEGKIDEARQLLDTVIEEFPETPDARFNRAQILLLTGNWRAGWRDYEYRRQRPGWRRAFPNPRHRPFWTGGDFSGQTLWVVAEQGYGDLLQMVRLAPAVKSRGGDVIVVADPTLHPVLNTAPGVDRVMGPPDNGDLAENYDWIVPVMSLPGLVGLDPDRTQAPVGYLGGNHTHLNQRSHRMPGKDFRVGVVWAGNPAHANDRRRSLTFEQLTPILEVSGARFFSLQTGPAATQLDRRAPGAPIVDLGRQFQHFGDTAQAMLTLDVIITVDTAAAHLAGALGCPVWVLLPWIPDWRWGLDRSTTAWYPSMRLFRQQNRDDWGAPVASAARVLTQLIHNGRTATVCGENDHE